MNKNLFQKWFKDLFPICRSITGNGLRQTLSYFEKINPELKRLKFKTGKKVFDWTIPKEWNISEAYIKHQSGKKFADLKKNNLHILNYSTPIKKKLNKKDLLKNIFTDKKRKKAIPYVTSYYKENWGFCLSETQKKKLPSGKYDVIIKSTLKKGFLDLSHAKFNGKSKKEIFFSSYCCHPSMANNELSGPILLNGIINHLKQNFQKTHYTYRFLLAPETIGSIAYLSKFKNVLKKNVICGFGLSCVGDNRAFSIIESRSKNSLADLALKSSLKEKKNLNIYSFLERGSDERQFCSPGINLPYVGYCRSKYGQYPEYHTSDDNLKMVKGSYIEESLEIFKTIIECFENGIIPVNNFDCEPQLGRRNLYPQISKKGNYIDVKNRMNLLAYSDGEKNIFEISNLIKSPLKELLEEYKILKKNKILKSKFF